MNKKKNKISPPNLAHYLLKRMISRGIRDSAIGDFGEIYSFLREDKSRLLADLWYWGQVLNSLPSFVYDKIFWGITMYRNYFMIALRNIKKNKIFSFINIFGFAVSIAAFIFILLYVQHELSYDDFNDNADRIYRVALERVYPDRTSYWGWMPPVLGNTLTSDFPEVEKATRICIEGVEQTINHNDRNNIETNGLYVDENFFDFFSIPIIHGDQATMLKNPNSIVLTDSYSKKYFGDENPLGKTLRINDNWWGELNCIVTGVSEDVPINSHFHYNYLISLNSTRIVEWTEWRQGWMVFTYVFLTEETNPEILENKISELMVQRFSDEIEDFRGYLTSGNSYNYFLQPLTDIHLTSNLRQEFEKNGNITYVYMFMAIALIILIIACVNFMNLSTAYSLKRAREIGIRKVLGSDRKQLISQYLFESIFISFFAFFIALGVVYTLLPYFNVLVGKTIKLAIINDPLNLLGLIALIFFVGLIAGSYPAFFMSSFKPVIVLKSKLKFNSKGSWIRGGLVIFQFASSIALIVATLVIEQQIDFMVNKDLGFSKDHVITINQVRLIGENFETFKNELNMNPNIVSYSGSETFPSVPQHSSAYKLVSNPDKKSVSIFNTSGGFGFIETLGIGLVKGRYFNPTIATDSSAVVLNEAAVALLGLKNPIGEKISIAEDLVFTIIGVVQNYHFNSLHQTVSPLAIYRVINPVYMKHFLVKVRSTNLTQTISHIENSWQKFSNGQPLSFSFLDQNIEKFYKNEQKSGQISAIFSFLAILIGCLGLFGLSAFAAEQRTKELGIRKILGASIPNLLILLSKDFTKLIVIAFIVTVPLSYILMESWLENFAFRINLEITVFILSGMIALSIAMITVSFQLIKAAFLNPVDSIKYE